MTLSPSPSASTQKPGNSFPGSGTPSFPPFRRVINSELFPTKFTRRSLLSLLRAPACVQHCVLGDGGYQRMFSSQRASWDVSKSCRCLLFWSFPVDLCVGVTRRAGCCVLSETPWMWLGAAVLRGIGRERTDIRRWKIRDESDTNSFPRPRKYRK